jgi:excinuclease ABC subunit A
VDAGNTALVIEHNLDMIRRRLGDRSGPGGRAAGGRLLAEGTPEQVAQVEASYTGQFLRQALAS